MKTVKLFSHGGSQALCIPKEYQFMDVTDVHIFREGDSVVIKSAKRTWLSLADVNIADSDFLLKRVDVVEER